MWHSHSCELLLGLQGCWLSYSYSFSWTKPLLAWRTTKMCSLRMTVGLCDYTMTYIYIYIYIYIVEALYQGMRESSSTILSVRAITQFVVHVDR